MAPLDQLRLRLTDHDFYRLMETAKPLAALDRDERTLRRNLAGTKWLDPACCIGSPGLLHRIISEVQLHHVARHAGPTSEGAP